MVAERLGHADQNIKLTIYSDAIPADSRAAARVWDDAMADVISESGNLERHARLQRFARLENEVGSA